MLKSKLKRRRSTTKAPVARRFRKVEYTIREAAELRGVHPNTVRRKILSGQINARIEIIEPLRIYRIPLKELEKIKPEPGKRTDLG